MLNELMFANIGYKQTNISYPNQSWQKLKCNYWNNIRLKVERSKVKKKKKTKPKYIINKKITNHILDSNGPKCLLESQNQKLESKLLAESMGTVQCRNLTNYQSRTLELASLP